MSNNEELQAFFGERRADLVRFAVLQLRDQSLAEDAVQETLMAAMQAISQFEGRSASRPGCFRFSSARSSMPCAADAGRFPLLN